MTGAVRAVGVILLLGILGYLLRQVGFRGSALVSLLGTVALLSLSVAGIGSLFSHIKNISSMTEGFGELVRDALKILGVGYLFGVSSDICRELGELGIAGSALVLGRVEILLICLPYIDKLFSLIGEITV